MKLYQCFFALFLLSTGLINVCNGQVINDNEQKALIEIQRSHIDGNIPDKSDFDAFLKRDLEKYFKKSYGKNVVKWEFLREGPTQSGVSYPKYYLWTKVYQFDNNKLLNEGAVRVEAIDKQLFKITDYINKKQLKDNKEDMYLIFPALVCEIIKTKL